LSQCALQGALEELQRGTLEGFLDASVQEITKTLTAVAQGAIAEWTACRPERLALAAHLRTAPELLFSVEPIPFWSAAVGLVAAVAAKLTASQPQVRLHATTI